jgi:hypothetical protein
MIRYQVAYGHNAFAFNAHLNADGSTNLANLKNTAVLDEAIVTPGYRDLRDPYHLAQGGALGRVHKGLLVVRMRGRLRGGDATQAAFVADKERALRAAFDPYLCSIDSPTTEGAYAFDFSSDTTDTATYATGRIPLRYYLRPAAQPETAETLDQGGDLPFRLALVAADPRLYEQTEQTLVLTPGGPAGAVVNRGTTPAPMKATIAVSGAGAANFTITRTGSGPAVAFVLDLTGLIATDGIVVLFETSGPYGVGKTISKTTPGGNSDAFSRKTSSPATWLNAPVGSTTFTITNTGGVTSCTLGWYSARA